MSKRHITGREQPAGASPRLFARVARASYRAQEESGPDVTPGSTGSAPARGIPPPRGVRSGRAPFPDAGARSRMIDRLSAAWQGALDLYLWTSVQSPVGPAVSWSEADLKLLVAHLLVTSPGGSLRVHQEVKGSSGFNPIALAVTAPGQGQAAARAPWARLTPESAVDLAIEIRVVNERCDHARLEADAQKLQTILRRKLAREVALCVLDKTSPPNRRFYEDLQDSRAVTILRAFDEELPRMQVPGSQGA